MEINKRSRNDLKKYFVKGAIPTESQFAEFIDGTVNPKDDGIVIDPGTGNIGLGNVVPAAKLHVGGNARIDGDLQVGGLVKPALPWVNLPESAKFTADPPNRAVPACCKDASGYVKLRGSYMTTTTLVANEIITTLAPGYRPAEKKFYVALLITLQQVAAAQVWLEIGPTGQIRLLSAISASGRYLTLDGISFDAASL